MAVFELECPKDIYTVNTLYYTLFINEISFEDLWG